MATVARRSDPGRAWLLATCVFGFALVSWNTFATPHFAGYLGANWMYTGPTTARVAEVTPSSPAARAGLRVGDTIEFPRQGVKYRTWLVGERIPLRVQRGGRVSYRSIVAVARPTFEVDWLNNLVNWLGTLVVGIIAWFGVGRRARLLSWLLISWTLSGGPALYGVVTPWPWLNEAAYLLNAPLSVLQVTLLATISSTFGRPLSPLRRKLELSTYAVTIIGIGVVLVLEELILITPWFDALFTVAYFISEFSIGIIAANVLAFSCAIVALATVRGADRQRAAWLLGPLAALVVLLVFWGIASSFAGPYNDVQERINIVYDVAVLVALA